MHVTPARALALQACPMRSRGGAGWPGPSCSSCSTWCRSGHPPCWPVCTGERTQQGGGAPAVPSYSCAFCWRQAGLRSQDSTQRQLLLHSAAVNLAFALKGAKPCRPCVGHPALLTRFTAVLCRVGDIEHARYHHAVSHILVGCSVVREAKSTQSQQTDPHEARGRCKQGRSELHLPSAAALRPLLQP